MRTFEGYIDGSFVEPGQIGPKIVTFPLQSQGEYFAFNTTRVYSVAFRELYSPILHRRTTLTNYLINSNDLGSWTTSNVSQESKTTDPEGNTSACILAETSATGAHSVGQAMTIPSGAFQFGVMVQASGVAYCRLRLYNATDGSMGTTVFQLSGWGSVASGSGSVQFIQKGWLWLKINGTATVANSTAYLDFSTDGATWSYAGSTSRKLIAWGATCVIAASSVVIPVIQNATATRSVTVPDVDQDDPLSFLVQESEPDGVAPASWKRVYARMPKTQLVPSSMGITKPTPSNGTDFPQINGAYMVFRPDSTLAKYDAYKRVAITSDSGAPASFYPTGGTYTLSFEGQTTASINYNDTNSTVQTRLNALSKVTDRGSVTVTGSYNSTGGLIATFGTISTGSISTSLTPSSTTNALTASNNGYTQAVSIVSPLSCTMPTQGATNENVSNIITDSGTPAMSRGTYTINGQYGVSYLFFALNSSTFNIIGGTYKVTVQSSLGTATTGDLPYNATFDDIKTAINALGVGLFEVNGYYYPDKTAPSAYCQYQDGNGVYHWGIVFFIYPVKTPITAGTYTISLLSQTTANIAYNASTSDIQAAINLLSNVTTRGGITVSGTALATDATSITFSINFANNTITGTSSLTPSGVITVNTASSGRVQDIHPLSTATRTIYAASHGAVNGGAIFLTDGTNNYSGITRYTVNDANTLTLTPLPSDAWGTGATLTYGGGRTKQNYQPGGATIRCNKQTSFFMPGYTEGISAASDIPIPENQGDQASFLAAAYSGSSVINYAVGDLVPYQWPILSLTTTQINASDV